MRYIYLIWMRGCHGLLRVASSQAVRILVIFIAYTVVVKSTMVFLTQCINHASQRVDADITIHVLYRSVFGSLYVLDYSLL